jgi:hypothetical protein
MFIVVVSKIANHFLFDTFLNAANHITKTYKPYSKQQAYELFETEYNVKLRVIQTPKHSDIYYIINFISEQEYYLFLYKWS